MNSQYDATFEEVFAFMVQIPPVKQINKRSTTYGIKHWVEWGLGKYVSECILVEALKKAGYKLRPTGLADGNYYTNLTSHRFKMYAPIMMNGMV
jgi:hypothetical protein